MVAAPPLEHDMSKRNATKLVALLFAPALLYAEMHVVIVEGLGGDELYARQFAEQVADFAKASATMTSESRIRVFSGDEVSRTAVLDHLESLASSSNANDQVVVYLVGHGSYDEFEYKFNIAGPDLTDIDLLDALNALPSRNQVLVSTGSSSGAVADVLGEERRLLVLGTRSGAERHATRFGNYFVSALDNPGADLDKNELISVLEAFEYAKRQVEDYFARNDHLATEHARMEGSRADRISLARLSGRTQARDSGDAELERLRGNRDQLNAEIDELRLARDGMPADEYQAQLLQTLLDLAAAEDAIEIREQELGIERQ
jgi:hypothetical protein